MMAHLLYGTWVERLVALAAQALVLWALGASIEGEHLWALLAVMATTLVLEFLAFQRGVEQGITIYAALTPAQQADVTAILNSNEEEQK